MGLWLHGRIQTEGLVGFNWRGEGGRGGIYRKMDKNYTVRSFCICVRILWFIVEVIQSRRKRWSEHVKRVGEIRKSYKVLVAKLEGRQDLDTW